MLTYKGYTGWFSPDEDGEILHGRVINIRDTVTFEGTSIEEIREAFRESVDDYLEFCEELGKEPSKPYNGNLSLRTTPELHARIEQAARKRHKSANKYIEEVLDKATPSCI